MQRTAQALPNFFAPRLLFHSTLPKESVSANLWWILTEFTSDSEDRDRFGRQAGADTAERPRIIVDATNEAFGLSRMFQILGEESRPLLHVARSLDDALSALGVQSPHFEVLD
jgi:hypothetical protein